MKISIVSSLAAAALVAILAWTATGGAYAESGPGRQYTVGVTGMR
jgi:hypothetical protein